MLYDDISVERFAEIRAEEVGEKRWEDGRQIGRAEGLAEGRAEGRRIKNLMQMLIQADRLDDLKKAAADDEYMETLLKEFNL